MSPLAAVLAVTAALSAGGDPTGRVQGIVRSAGTGLPVAYANLQVLGRGIADWTDPDGAYTLDGLPEGRWTIKVAHPNHDSLTLEVFVPAGRGLSLDLSLDERPGPVVDALSDFAPFRVDYVLPALLNSDEVAAAIAERYPPELLSARASGETVLRIWLDERGQPVRSEVTRSSGYPALDSVAAEVWDRMRFRPAKNRGSAMRVIVQIPVVFTQPTLPPGSEP